MIESTLSQAANWLHGTLQGRDLPFKGVSIDSREQQPRSLFVALRGERHDAHRFVGQAIEHGAVAAVVERECDGPVAQIQVDDTTAALGLLAAGWRDQMKATLVAVTGSNGKTTVKEMLAGIVAVKGKVLATRGNLNNHIGLPLTLLRLAPEHRFAVVEMGASGAGEIAWLTGLAKPTVAVVNNAAAAHLQGFGSVDAVARAKGEIFSGLVEGGVAVFNGDDPRAGLWRRQARGHRILEFGLARHHEVRAEAMVAAGQFVFCHGDSRVPVQTGLPGRHNVMNALAAGAAALALGLSLDEVAAGLARVRPVPGRLQRFEGLHGSIVIDDTYNANPASLAVALETVSSCAGECWLVLGDMAELGEQALELHVEAGQKAREQGVARLFAIGSLGSSVASAFGAGGRCFEDMPSLCRQLAESLAGADRPVTVLVKGSRSMRMERVVDALRQRGSAD